jgi:D-xylose transport system substrate-binding protein
MVGVILPDTSSSTRYTLYDAPLLKAAFDAAGIQSDIQNAQGSTANFQQIAQSMIGEGVKVLIIDSIDPTSGIAVEQQATAAGVKVIDYDRVNPGGQAAYYVSFDNLEVGTLQGQTLVDCLNQSGASKPKIIMEDGGTDVDNNAVLFAQGARNVLTPLQKSGTLTIESEVVDKGWGHRERGTDLQPGAHRGGWSGGRRRRRQRRHRERRHQRPAAERSRRACGRHRSGRPGRGSAEHPQGPAEHDGLQERHLRSGRRRQAGDRADQRP